MRNIPTNIVCRTMAMVGIVLMSFAGEAADGSLSAALDCPSLSFSTGGDASWRVETGTAAMGASCLRSGMIGDSQETWVETTVSGPRLLSFQWKVSSESVSWDYVAVSVDGVERAKIGGVGSGWKTQSVAVQGAGLHTVRWTYQKDVSYSSGDDCAWLDAVSLAPLPTSIAVTFDANGGRFTSGGTRKTVSLATDANYGEAGAALPDVTYPGSAELAGWATKSVGGVLIQEGDPVDFSITNLFARWTIPFEEAMGETPGIDWDNCGQWYGQPTISHDGNGAMCPDGNVACTICSESLSAAVTGNGTLSFWWRRDGINSDVACSVYYNGDWNSEAWRHLDSWTYEYNQATGDYECVNSFGVWKHETIELYGNGDHRIQWYGRGRVFLDEVSWTPAPAFVSVRMVVGGGRSDVVQSLAAGSTYDELPDPAGRMGWTFFGWYLDDKFLQPAAGKHIPFAGATVYAKWVKPVGAVMNGNGFSFSSQGTAEWLGTELKAPNGGPVAQLEMTSEKTANLAVSFAGAGFLSYYLMRDYTYSADVVQVIDGEVEDTNLYSGEWKQQRLAVGAGKHALDLTGFSQWYTDPVSTNVFSVGGFTFEPYGPQADFSAWFEKFYKWDCWVTNDLTRVKGQLASDTSYKGLIKHALVTVMALGEDKTLQSSLESFGWTLDYLKCHVGGETDFSKAPQFNALVDRLFAVGEPAIKAALGDLEKIPATWKGSVTFTPDECCRFDEETSFDFGDITYLKAGLKGLLAWGRLMKAYNAEVDYEQAEQDDAGRPIRQTGSAAALLTEAGWTNIDWLRGDGRLCFKVAAVGDELYLYVHREEGEATAAQGDEGAEIKLESSSSHERFVAYGSTDSDDIWGDLQMTRVATSADFVVWKANLDNRRTSDYRLICVERWGSYYYYWDSWKNVHGSLRRFLATQTKVGDKIRSKSDLTAAKVLVKEALTLLKTADARVVARTDGQMHFIEYNPDDEREVQKLSALRQQVDVALASLDGGAKLFNQRYRTDKMLLQGLPETFKMDLKAAFDGKLTRSTLPKSANAETYVAELGASFDPTVGGIFPGFTRADWEALFTAYDFEYAQNGQGVDPVEPDEPSEGNPVSGQTKVDKITYGWERGWYDEEDVWQADTLRIVSAAGATGKVTLPKALSGRTVASVAVSAFAANAKVTEIWLPETVCEIEAGAFANCKKLASVWYLGDEPVVCPTLAGCCGGFITDLYNGAPAALVSHRLLEREWNAEIDSPWQGRAMSADRHFPDASRTGSVTVRVREGRESLGAVSGGKPSVKGGTKVTVKAAAKKDAAFRGWYEIDPNGACEPILRSVDAAYSFTATGYDTVLEAEFLAAGEDWLYVYDDGNWSFGLNETVGPCTMFCLSSGSALTSVKIAGTPTGIKAEIVKSLDGSASVVFSGAPTKAGVYWVSCTAKNGNGYMSSAMFKWTVGNVPETDYDDIGLGEALNGWFATGVPVDLDLCLDASLKSVTGLPTGLEFHASYTYACEERSNFISGTPTKAGKFIITLTAQNGRKAVKTVVVRDSGCGYFRVAPGQGCEGRGTVSGSGVYARGATIKLTAKPTSGSVFAGWYADEFFECPLDCVSDGWQKAPASYVFVDGAECGDGRTAYARFVSKDEDRINAWFPEDTWVVEPGDCLFYARQYVYVDSASAVTLSAKGMPSDCTFDKTSGALVFKKKPTKPGAATVTVTAKNASGNVATATVVVRVPNLRDDLFEGLDYEGTYVVLCGFGGCSESHGEFSLTENGWTVKATGLPAGLTIEKTDGSDHDYYFRGTATKSGVYTVTLTATKKGETTRTATVTYHVRELPRSVVGTFNGFLLNRYNEDEVCGTFTLTATDTGKLTATLVLADGAKKTYTANLWDCGDYDGYASYFTKRGSSSGCADEERITIYVRPNDDWTDWQVFGEFDIDPCMDGGVGLIRAQRNPFGKAGSVYENAEARAFVNMLVRRGTMETYAFSDGEGGYTLAGPACCVITEKAALTFKVKADGTVTMAGKLGGRSLSATTVLHVGDNRWSEGDEDLPYADFWFRAGTTPVRAHIEFSVDSVGCRHGYVR